MEAKNSHHFRFKAKWSKTEAKNAIIFASKRNGSKIFCFDAKKCFFACFCIWSETKMKLSENKAKKMFISFHIEAKRKDRKRNEKIGSETKRNKKIWKWNKAKIHSINFALVGSEKFEAKWSEKKGKFFFFTWACKTHAKRISFHFVSLWSEEFFFCETGAP